MEDEIRALEARRCELLGVGDLQALAALLDDDYIHVHGHGSTTDKAETLTRLGTQPRAVERGPLTVTVWGDAALVIGEQINRTPGDQGRVTRATVSQTLRRRNGVWRFLSLHFTALRD